MSKKASAITGPDVVLFPDSDVAASSPERIEGTLKTVGLDAISLIETIRTLKGIVKGEAFLKSLFPRFNRDYRNANESLGGMYAEYKKAVVHLFPITGAEIDGYRGTSCAEIARQIGFGLYLRMHVESGSDRSLEAIGAIPDNVFVPLDVAAVIEHWDSVRETLEEISTPTLERLYIVLWREMDAITNAASGWPILTCKELRAVFRMGQDQLLKLLAEKIPHEKLSTQKYKVDPSKLPGDWKTTLKRQ